MKRIKKYLDIRFEKHKKEWDTVIIIAGDVGIGKSNLGLHILEYWLMKLYGEVKPSDIKHMCLTKKQFVQDLSDCKKNEMTVFDEAGEISSRKAMTKFNSDLAITYQIIRADCLFTVLILPDVKYIDSYFRYTRVKHLFYVYKRGKVAVFLKRKFKQLMSYNENRMVFNYKIIRPTFHDDFSIYKGVMKENYEKLKVEKLAETRRNLIKEISNVKKPRETMFDLPKHLVHEVEVNLLLRQGMSQAAISRTLDMDRNNVGLIKKKLEKGIVPNS